MNTKPQILIVDDDEINLEIIQEYLDEKPYQVITASNGEEAWNAIENNELDLILLDRMMPDVDGLEILKKIKKKEKFKTIPVIMQTARSSEQDILEGLQAGAHYYLTKPFEQDMLLSVVHTALSDHKHHQSLQNKIEQSIQGISLLQTGTFHFQTIEHANNLAMVMANAFPEPSRVVLGLSELFINAVEHGNLGISYKEKSLFMKEKNLASEIQQRLEKNTKKFVFVNFSRSKDKVNVRIKDQGDGFDWKKYMTADPARAQDSHGRGIMMANMISFDDIEYAGNGNTVNASVLIK
jgi:CheY-like chemotaxis protein/anti-sigma regulatory factor (Ser/Thr protein kinase)